MNRITSWIAAAGLAVSLVAAPAFAKTEEAKRPAVEVVFVLDTTGSMSGLIQAAKEKIWAIANTLATAKPAPDIKMGIVGYRDRGDEYVTRLVPMTDDLDAVYSNLMGFNADGGGDTPESVNQALAEAVSKMDWATSEEVYRVIFLVGDAPPHMDYDNDVKYADTCKAAIERGIYINTIQCGTISETAPIWKEIAMKAEGRDFRVEQEGGAILASTPFDTELGELASQLESTRCYYGTEAEQRAGAEKLALGAEIAAAAPESGKASRAEFHVKGAGAKNLFGQNELIHDVANGTVKLEDIKKEELPTEFQSLAPEELTRHVALKEEERKEIQSKIEDLSKKRQAYMAEQMKQNAGKAKDSLDAAVYECVQKQAEKVGLKYEGGPEL